MPTSRELSERAALEGAEIIRQNYEGNRAVIEACPGVRDLAKRWTSARAIVVGAGPSLNAALPLLQTTEVPIIACDRAAAPLLSAGIKPWCIVTVEMSLLGAKKMEGVQGLETVPLVFDPFCCPLTVDRYPGPLFTYDRPDIVTGKGPIRLGTGVAPNAVGLAEALGAREIILVGVDLSYPDDKRHADGVVIFESSSIIEGAIGIQSTAGAIVMSDYKLVAHAEEISQAAKKTRIVQTSPIGAFIPNAEHRPLGEVLCED